MIFGKISEVKTKMDFIQWLGPDMSIKVLSYLDHPCDLVRVSSVSRSWNRFVIENGLCKQLFFEMFPEISDVVDSVEVDNMMIEPVTNMLDNCANWECLKREHKAYAVMAFKLKPYVKNCISKAIAASSTNNYPEESIVNTLEPGDRTENRASYWLSEGQSSPGVPESLVYKLCSKICLITKIRVQPFQAYFQDGSPIYSAYTIRFRIGHPRHHIKLESAIAHGIATSNMVGDTTQFVWTYTSPYYQMLQENQLQEFTLPEPALGIGGVLLVELRGRVQQQGLYYYIGISHVQVVGLPILQAFDVKTYQPSGKYTLKYCPPDNCIYSASSSRSDSNNHSRLWSLTSSITKLDVILFMMHCLVLVLGILLLMTKKL
ncbi:F-box protein At4g00755-like [Trifolium pratense]|uniref:F-box protein At4g00755-like n=1 Tax=Trifolium pratense TaxID=57577 RepID=UPI001E6907B3|nr:F-box protein At4g00755-like [Trifolium pratense]